MITGAFCGTGAGFAGNLFISATSATGATCLSYLAGSGMAAFGSGFTGSLAGQGVSAAIDGRKLNAKEAVCSAIKTGTVNCLSGIGAGIGNAIKGMPEFTTTTTTVANSVNSGWSAIWEMVCDFLGVISIGLS